MLYSLASNSTHPISLALCEYFKNEKLLDLKSVENIAGQGIKAKFQNQELLGGSALFMKENAVNLNNFNQINHLSSQYYFAINGDLVAHFSLSDNLRTDAKSVLCELKKMGYKIIMLSGDKKEVAKNVSLELGIAEFYGELNPLDKAQKIKELQKQAPVLMVGDGINDIAALKSAHVGICMGSGASISVENSDVVLLRDELSALLFALRLSARTYRTIKQNLAFSLVYNALTIPLAMLGYIIPLFAAISMSASSIIVVLNSLKIKGQK